MGFEPTTAGITIQKPNQCLCCLQVILGNIKRCRYLLYITCYFFTNRPRLSRLGFGAGKKKLAIDLSKERSVILIRWLNSFIRVVIFRQKRKPVFVLRKEEELDPWNVAVRDSLNMRDVKMFNALIRARNQEMIPQQERLIH